MVGIFYAPPPQNVFPATLSTVALIFPNLICVKSVLGILSPYLLPLEVHSLCCRLWRSSKESSALTKVYWGFCLYTFSPCRYILHAISCGEIIRNLRHFPSSFFIVDRNFSDWQTTNHIVAKCDTPSLKKLFQYVCEYM